jgi:hypothetical protein
LHTAQPPSVPNLLACLFVIVSPFVYPSDDQQTPGTNAAIRLIRLFQPPSINPLPRSLHLLSLITSSHLDLTTMARVIAQPPSPSSDSERIYACQHCPKRYARKDYLERHELNRE